MNEKYQKLIKFRVKSEITKLSIFDSCLTWLTRDFQVLKLIHEWNFKGENKKCWKNSWNRRTRISKWFHESLKKSIVFVQVRLQKSKMISRILWKMKSAKRGKMPFRRYFSVKVKYSSIRFHGKVFSQQITMKSDDFT